MSLKTQKITLFRILVWCVALVTSFYLSIDSRSDSARIYGLTIFAIDLSVLAFVYLINSYVLIPRFLFSNKKRMFIMYNAILIAILICLSYIATSNDFLDVVRPEALPKQPRSLLIHSIKDFINYILIIGLATAIRLNEQLHLSEEALKEAENARVSAELSNLRSQINPHFLLNTLNNIYSLTMIDTERAQKSIQELSHLLRYVLYDNLDEKVDLKAEVGFLKNYIELMRIRLPRAVKLNTEFIYSDTTSTLIAPLLFISLIENAFKHSVSDKGEGFIDIRFEDDTQNKQIKLSITNSNHAKTLKDKSGHGIGLEQVQKRLELQYAGSYTWNITHNEQEYSSVLILNL